jgi:Putative Actinobacterial Holin-X, holin superfamily III
MATHRMPVNPDAGIPDLVRRLTDDSKRLVSDEVRLLKLESRESLSRGGRGAMWLGVGFGLATVGLVAFTLFLATLIGRAAAGHMWVGALITGALELAAAVLVVRRGLLAFGEPSYSLEQTRQRAIGLFRS